MSEIITEIYEKNVPTFYKLVLKELTKSFKLKALLKTPNAFTTKQRLNKWCDEIITFTKDLFSKYEFNSKYYHLGKELADFLTSKVLKDNSNIVNILK